MDNGKGADGIAVQKVDTNELLRQVGVFEALKDEPKKELTEEKQ